MKKMKGVEELDEENDDNDRMKVPNGIVRVPGGNALSLSGSTLGQGLHHT